MITAIITFAIVICLLNLLGACCGLAVAGALQQAENKL